MSEPATSADPREGADPILTEAPHHVGRVTLVVRDLDRVGRFYEEVIGLAPLGESGGVTRFGAGGRTILQLRQEPTARLWTRREAGLFHTAFLLPSRADLGAWLGHMIERRFRIEGASDHLVSEAVYLSDPEGNGIEIYADRPSATWRRTDGTVAMSTDPMDVDAVLGAATRPWSGMPAAGRIGHMHLQAGDLSRAGPFYADLLGFDIAARYPGALFFGSGGYHHQLATNLWNSRGAPARDDLTTGLAEIELVLKSDDLLQATRARFAAAGYPLGDSDTGVVVRDPWGTAHRLIAG